MPGSPPPEDAPPPEEQEQATADASFEPAPSGAELCGFPLPGGFSFNLSFTIPPLDFEFPPTLPFPLGLSCDLAEENDAPDGGGRVGDEGLDADPEFG